jgi:hypothetical protein
VCEGKVLILFCKKFLTLALQPKNLVLEEVFNKLAKPTNLPVATREHNAHKGIAFGELDRLKSTGELFY